MFDLAIDLGKGDVRYFVGLVIGTQYTRDLESAMRLARKLSDKMHATIAVWPMAGDAPIAPAAIRAYAKSLVEETDGNEGTE